MFVWYKHTASYSTQLTATLSTGCQMTIAFCDDWQNIYVTKFTFHRFLIIPVASYNYIIVGQFLGRTSFSMTDRMNYSQKWYILAIVQVGIQLSFDMHCAVKVNFQIYGENTNTIAMCITIVTATQT